MASGGSTPLTCSICLEDKEDKSPRVLSCQHSFCQKCLESWNNKNKGYFAIECPTCRKRTMIHRGGVAGLPLDFKVKEFAEFLHSNTLDCQACRQHGRSAIQKGICKTCDMRLCERCVEEHTRVALFSAHRVTEAFCFSHGAALTYVCVTCSRGICAACVLSECHTDHEIKEAEAGLNKTKEKLEKMKNDLKECMSAFNKEIQLRKQVCYDKQRESDINIADVCDHFKQEVEEILATKIEKHKTEHRAALVEIFWKFKVSNERHEGSITELDGWLQEDAGESLLHLQGVSESGKRSIDELNSEQQSLPEPIHLSTETCRLRGLEEALEALKKCTLDCGVSPGLCRGHGRSVPALIKQVEYGPENGISRPWNVSTTLNGDALICNHGGSAYRLKLDGMVEVLWDTTKVNTCCVQNNDIYLVDKTGNKIIKLSEGSEPKTFLLNPPIENPYGIIVLEDRAYLCNKNGIIKYSLTGLTGHWIFEGKECTSIIRTSLGGIGVFVVTENSSNQIVIYDECGKEIRRFGNGGSGDGQLQCPFGIDRMSNGNFIVADHGNSRLVEYEPEGKFVGNFLCQTDGLERPTDVAFAYPYIYVTEWSIQSQEIRSVKRFMYHL